MRILQMTDSRSTAGALAQIVFDPEGATVYKLFKSRHHPGNISQFRTEPYVALIGRWTFIAESEAYEILGGDADLEAHAPKYHGRVTVEDVIDENGVSVANHYLLDCCYCLDRIVGRDVKRTSLTDEACSAVGAIESSFHAAGIAYTLDASFFNSEQPDKILMIDFATRDVAQVIEDDICQCGEVTEGTHRLLKLQ